MAIVGLGELVGSRSPEWTHRCAGSCPGTAVSRPRCKTSARFGRERAWQKKDVRSTTEPAKAIVDGRAECVRLDLLLLTGSPE